jgi:hypothetical protein
VNAGNSNGNAPEEAMHPLIAWALTTLVSALVGSYLAGYLKRKGENLASHEDINRLVTQMSQISEATKQIEARIGRASRIHEKQMVILQKLYVNMSEVQGIFMRMTASGRLEGELTPEVYAPELQKALSRTYEQFINARLYLPGGLIKLCEKFFDTVSMGRINTLIAYTPGLDPNQFREHFDKAGKAAYTEVPEILKEIEKTARDVIHGSST